MLHAEPVELGVLATHQIDRGARAAEGGRWAVRRAVEVLTVDDVQLPRHRRLAPGRAVDRIPRCYDPNVADQF